jgi:AcrR family transcriptional regulator
VCHDRNVKFTGAPASTRRERLRRRTEEEILGVARDLLVAGGPGAVSLRAIAREMGMTAPGLYRYHASHEDLLTALIAMLYDELTVALVAARDTVPPGDVPGRLLTSARAFREWSRAHPAELGLLFGSPMPGYAAPAEGPSQQAGRRFGTFFLDLFIDLWVQRPFPVNPDDQLDTLLAEEIRRWVPPQSPLPIGAIILYLRCWMRLYGAVTMEVFGHLNFAVADAEALFELELRGVCDLLALQADYRPPAGTIVTGRSNPPERHLNTGEEHDDDDRPPVRSLPGTRA